MKNIVDLQNKYDRFLKEIKKKECEILKEIKDAGYKLDKDGKLFNPTDVVYVAKVEYEFDGEYIGESGYQKYHNMILIDEKIFNPLFNCSRCSCKNCSNKDCDDCNIETCDSCVELIKDILNKFGCQEIVFYEIDEIEYGESYMDIELSASGVDSLKIYETNKDEFYNFEKIDIFSRE